ncbi:MAG TPA: hypothetical protein DCZ92_02075 [Elusimicrobia bacterium]|nr:hypothetical protein [Elusimicrobiota bacterium]
METRNISVEFKLTRDRALGLLVVLFLTWRPGFLGSENLTLTTYYPAPYGGYVNILTTNNTLLARDGGSVSVGTLSAGTGTKLTVKGGIAVGPTSAGGYGYFNLDQGGSLELGGYATSETPYIDFHGLSDGTADYSIRMIGSRDTSGRRLLRLVGTETGGIGNMEITGILWKHCDSMPYTNGSMTYCGGSSANSAYYTIMWRGNSSRQFDAATASSLPTSGTIVCCRISQSN